MDEKMADSDGRNSGTGTPTSNGQRHFHVLIILLLAAAVYLGCAVSPPSLMDDVDAVQAQIARNMFDSGDWVTARLDGVAYLEKPPLIYWAMALSYEIFGVHDWAARLPVALSSIALCWVTMAFGAWAFGQRGGFYAGLCMSTCIGLFLFTRILIPDVMLSGSICLALWSFLRAIDDEEPRPGLWAFVMAACLGTGLLLKSLIGVLFPVGAALIYLALMRQLMSPEIWKRLRPLSGSLIVLLIAAPWHVLAVLRNPPFLDFTMHSANGEYHGFFWFFVINEQLLRFLNLRYPRDYDTVPRLYFWLLHLLWLFPWSVYLPAAGAGLTVRPASLAGKTRLLASCWIGFVLVFFTFSTTQEYYSMPCYPAFALLLGASMSQGGAWVRRGNRALALVAALAGLTAFVILFLVANYPSPGDISSALNAHSSDYTLALDHVRDLTLPAFAYLRLPLALAGAACTIGAAGMFWNRTARTFLPAAAMMAVFFHAARLALVVFDPYLASRALAETLARSPRGTLVIDHHYYTFSSLVFYSGRQALLLNGRVDNLIYGSNAPGAPPVFIDDGQFKSLWLGERRYYLVAEDSSLDRFQKAVGKANIHVVSTSGGKTLFTNLPLSAVADLGTRG
jgi:4-amino-4-deoxy-L-arabinose transferase-like glycosyltransferase